jgi:hypothetical protein
MPTIAGISRAWLMPEPTEGPIRTGDGMAIFGADTRRDTTANLVGKTAPAMMIVTGETMDVMAIGVLTATTVREMATMGTTAVRAG